MPDKEEDENVITDGRSGPVYPSGQGPNTDPELVSSEESEEKDSDEDSEEETEEEVVEVKPASAPRPHRPPTSPRKK